MKEIEEATMEVLYKYDGLHNFRTEDRSADYGCVASCFEEAVAMFMFWYSGKLGSVIIVNEKTGERIELPKVIRKLEIVELDPELHECSHEGWDLISADGGKTFWRCGSMRLFNSLEEAEKCKAEVENGN